MASMYELVSIQFSGYHGHLTSSNCVIDSKWVCKITDHGLNYVKKNYHKEKKIGADNLLWTAPEILRMPEDDLEHKTNEILIRQRADVFSFGIVCQEIVLQNAPYALNEPSMSTEEIIGAVKRGTLPLIRPDLQGWLTNLLCFLQSKFIIQLWGQMVRHFIHQVPWVVH